VLTLFEYDPVSVERSTKSTMMAFVAATTMVVFWKVPTMPPDDCYS
jgi:hypothetical protein